MAMSLDGRITNWNRAAENLFGYSAIDIVGTNISLLFPRTRRQADAPEDLVSDLERLGRGEHITAFETVRVRQDGRRIEILQSYSSIRDRNGAVTSASAIVLDITERKRSERYLAAEQAVTLILTDSKSLEDAGPKVLQTVADCLRWEVALLWIVDRDANILRLSSTHSSPWANPEFFRRSVRRQSLVAAKELPAAPGIPAPLSGSGESRSTKMKPGAAQRHTKACAADLQCPCSKIRRRSGSSNSIIPNFASLADRSSRRWKTSRAR